jgi:N utilization substance protein B
VSQRGTVGKRRAAREMAVQMLYQLDLGGSPLPQVFNNFDPGDAAGGPRRRNAEQAFAYAQELVRGTLEHRDAIDELIRGQAENWRLERMPAVDRNILRLAVYEMLHERDVPKLVVVDEAIELAKKYGSEHSGKFVNGLLDGLLKTHRFPGSLK